MRRTGHLDVGISGAIFVLLIAFATVQTGAHFARWPRFLDWPWWAQGLSVLGALVVFAAGAALEGGRRWPPET